MTVQQALRGKIDRREMIVAMGAWDVLSAKMIQDAGYEMVAIQTFQYAAGWGVPDAEFRTPSDMLELVFKTAGEINTPILADLGSGFGGPANAAYWAREFERAGAAAVHIEDTVGTEMCAWYPGQPVSGLLPAEEMAAKIAAMAEARQQELVIVARSKAGVFSRELGLDEEIRRLRMYREAGADVLWMPYAPKFTGDRAGIRRAVEELDAPLLAQANPPDYFPGFGDWLPGVRFEELERLGIRIFCCPQIYPVAYRALWEALLDVRQAGSLEVVADRMLSFARVQELTGFAPRQQQLTGR